MLCYNHEIKINCIKEKYISAETSTEFLLLSNQIQQHSMSILSIDLLNILSSSVTKTKHLVLDLDVAQYQ